MRVEIEQLTASGIWRPVRNCYSTDEAIRTLRHLILEGGHDPESFRVREFPDENDFIGTA